MHAKLDKLGLLSKVGRLFLIQCEAISIGMQCINLCTILLFQRSKMAAQIKYVLIFSMLLCYALSMTIERNSESLKEMESGHEKEFKRGSCKNICWGEFESCLRIGTSLVEHLLCLEVKDKCYSHC